MGSVTAAVQHAAALGVLLDVVIAVVVLVAQVDVVATVGRNPLTVTIVEKMLVVTSVAVASGRRHRVELAPALVGKTITLGHLGTATTAADPTAAHTGDHHPETEGADKCSRNSDEERSRRARRPDMIERLDVDRLVVRYSEFDADHDRGSQQQESDDPHGDFPSV